MENRPGSKGGYSVWDKGGGGAPGGGRPPGGGGGRPPGGAPRGPAGPGGHSGRPDNAAPLPPDYLKNGYFDDQGRIRRELILDVAKDVAQAIAEDRRLVRDRIGSSAIRAFFSHVRGVEAQLDARKPFDDVKPGIWRLRKMAEYQRQRREPPVNETFIDFIADNLPLAEKDEKHFRAFVEHFESVMAFFPRR